MRADHTDTQPNRCEKYGSFLYLFRCRLLSESHWHDVFVVCHYADYKHVAFQPDARMSSNLLNSSSGNPVEVMNRWSVKSATILSSGSAALTKTSYYDYAY